MVGTDAAMRPRGADVASGTNVTSGADGTSSADDLERGLPPQTSLRVALRAQSIRL
jgi:hypothetical protein